MKKLQIFGKDSQQPRDQHVVAHREVEDNEIGTIAGCSAQAIGEVASSPNHV